jgi:hypothetical protein
MPEVIVKHVKGGWISIAPDYVVIEDDNKEEVVYWDESEPGNAEAAQAALNAITLALTEGVGSVQRIIEEGKP